MSQERHMMPFSHTNVAEHVQRLNTELQERSAVDRIRFVMQFASQHDLQIVQTTSFGIQSAVMFQLLALAAAASADKSGEAMMIHNSSNSSNSNNKKVPIIFIDTGYLPKETYLFADQLTERFDLDLRVYQSAMSPARMEATHGKLWQVDTPDAHELYNTIRKVIPMQVALTDLKASIVLTGLRAAQTNHRQNLSYVNIDHQQSLSSSSSSQQQILLKVCPILDWEDDTVNDFFVNQDIPYHPLYAKGYHTVGDWHSSQPYDPIKHKTVRDSRFHGRTQECGLHLSMSSLDLVRVSNDDNDKDYTDNKQQQQQQQHDEVSSSPSYISSSNDDSSSSGSSLEDSGVGYSSSAAAQQHGNDNHGFVIYGRPNCKYCRAAKALLQQVVAHLEDVTITEVHVGRDVTQQELLRLLGDDSIQTVPQILYKGQYIGGYDNLCQWGPTRYEPSAFVQLSQSIIVVDDVQQ